MRVTLLMYLFYKITTLNNVSAVLYRIILQYQDNGKIKVENIQKKIIWIANTLCHLSNVINPYSIFSGNLFTILPLINNFIDAQESGKQKDNRSFYFHLCEKNSAMPLYMDLHKGLKGVKKEVVENLHLQDVNSPN